MVAVVIEFEVVAMLVISDNIVSSSSGGLMHQHFLARFAR